VNANEVLKTKIRYLERKLERFQEEAEQMNLLHNGSFEIIMPSKSSRKIDKPVSTSKTFHSIIDNFSFIGHETAHLEA